MSNSSQPFKIWMPTSSDTSKEVTWINEQIGQISVKVLKALAMKAAESRKNAYCPYSKYQVGAALLSSSGKIYTGFNQENVAYTPTRHAEESAVCTAVLSEEINNSGRSFIKALAVSHSGDSGPCGYCRQVIAEHSDNCLLLCVNVKGSILYITSLNLLFPRAFTPACL